MFALLTASQVQPAQAYRYFVELASDDLELDAYGETVPSDYKRLDVVVNEPTEGAITELIGATDWLTGYTMVNHWVPDFDCDCF